VHGAARARAAAHGGTRELSEQMGGAVEAPSASYVPRLRVAAETGSDTPSWAAAAKSLSTVVHCGANGVIVRAALRGPVPRRAVPEPQHHG
jgi:hypothetical protein